MEMIGLAPNSLLLLSLVLTAWATLFARQIIQGAVSDWARLVLLALLVAWFCLTR